ncbi:MAG: STAS domain-containing protein [Gemmatirosa sp.]|nr:STAS domain-containing protein [Gemmatirosa sp.]
MQISVAQHETVFVVAVAGSLDALTADTLTSALQSELQQGHTQLVAALEGLDYTSSAGLRVLLATVKEARRLGGDLRLAGAQERVRRVLDLSGFTSILKCYADAPAAVASYAA